MRLHFSEPSDSPIDRKPDAIVAKGLVTEDLKPASSLQAWAWHMSRLFEWCLDGSWRLLSSGRWVTCMLLVASLGWFSASADVGQALGWLQNQVQTSGIVRTLSAVAAPEQTQCEVAQTLLTLSGNGPQVASLVATLQNDSQAVTQTIACRRSLELAGGASPTGTLMDRQQSSGGFASYSDQAGSSLLDTGWALQSEVSAMSASDQSLLIAWLQSQQNADGSFGKARGASLLATAKILNGLKGAVTTSAAAAQIAQQAVAYLLSARDSAGAWASDIGLTAIVFEAVQPYSGSDARIGSSVADYLLKAQGADGSWGGDPYVTALALRALYLTGLTPSNPIQAGNQTTVLGTVSNGATGQALAGATLTITRSGSAPQSVSANASGAYSISLPAGAATVTVSASGYNSVSTGLTLVAGTRLNFSPALLVVGSPAASPGGAVVGTVVDAATQAPLSGAKILATALSTPSTTYPAQSGADGQFNMALPAGSYALAVSATGYKAQSYQVSLTDGSKLQLGTVQLNTAPTTSSLSGSVKSSAGSLVSGATISVVAGGMTATTSSGVSGSYSVSNLPTAPLQITVSATGFRSSSLTLTPSQAGSYTQDFVLAPSGNSSGVWSLGNLVFTPTSTGANQTIALQVTATNNGAVLDDVQARILMSDSTGKLIANVGPQDAMGAPVSRVSAAPAQSKVLNFSWSTGTFPVDAYSIVAQLYVPGSATAQQPQGQLLATLSSGERLQLVGSPHFSGGLVADPPVLQLGNLSPVQLSATVQNDGNQVLSAQSFSLIGTDTSGAVVYSQTVNAAALNMAQLTSLSFPSWTPTAAGDYQFLLSSASTPGQVTRTVHVGDYGKGQFTVDQGTVPPGQQKVRATINTLGVDVANGSVSDPLAPLVKSAITKAVNYADTLAYNHYVSDNQCFACHVQAQTVVGGERNLKFAPPQNPLLRAVLANGITEYQSPVGSLHFPGDGTVNVKVSSTLGLWALGEWHRQASVRNTQSALARYLMTVQEADGTWTSDHVTSWWRTPPPLTGLNTMSLVALRQAVAAGAASTRPKLGLMPAAGLPTGDMRLAADAVGNVYVANRSSSQIWVVTPQGAATLLVPSIPVTSIATTRDGRILVSAHSGVFWMQPDGNLTALSTLDALDAKPIGGSGRYVVVGADNKPYVMGADGQTQLLGDAQARAVYGTVVAAAVDAQNNILLLNQQVAYNVYSILTYSGAVIRVDGMTGQVLDFPSPRTNGRPMDLAPIDSGYLLSTDGGVFQYDNEWLSDRVSHDGSLGLASLPDGRWVVNTGGVLKVTQGPASDPGLLSDLDQSIARAANALMGGVGVNPNNNVDLAFQLMGLGALQKYYAGTARLADVNSAISNVSGVLAGRQLDDGGWHWLEGANLSGSDSMVTAMVGVALDINNPSPLSAQVRNAVQLLLSRQQPNGSWASENGVALGYTYTQPNLQLIPSTWVEIWLPVMLDRLGGIDAQLQVTVPANVTLSNPDLPLISSVAQPDGGTLHTWKLVGVTSAGQKVNFDLSLQNMQIGEVRPVALSANLVMNNSLTGGTVTAPITVPVVSVDNGLSLAVATDKPSYTESDQATFTATLTSNATTPQTAQVRMSVLDANQKLVATLPLPGVSAVNPGSTATASLNWSAGTVISGGYQVKAELINAQGLAYASATAPFKVVASQGVQVSAHISTDRSTYSAAQTIQIQDQVRNLTSNTLLNGLVVQTDVIDSTGRSVNQHSESLAQMVPGGFQTYGYSLPAKGLAAGNYTARLTVGAASDPTNALAQHSAAFSIQDTSQTGVGLSGALQATPASVPIGQPVALAFKLSNAGNAALNNATVRVRVIDPDTGNVLGTFSQANVSLNTGAQQSFNWTWPAAGIAGKTVVASATVQLITQELPLAQANIALTAAALQPFTGTLSASPTGVQSGQAVQLTYTALNPNSVPQDATLTLSIRSAGSSTVLQKWDMPQTLAANSRYAGNQSWVVPGAVGTQYQATWTATVAAAGGAGSPVSSVLATANFSVTTPAVQLQINAQADGSTQPRLLVLVSCSSADDGLASSPACDEPKAQALRDYFNAVGLSAKVVTTQAEFETDMRCGLYNLYWVSGGAGKLSDTSVKELREAAERGAGLVLDGSPHARDALVHSALGVVAQGSTGLSKPSVSLGSSGLFAPGSFNSLGKPIKLALQGGTAQATYSSTQGSAIVSRSVGQGHSLVFGFNLTSLLVQAQAASNSTLFDLMQRSVNFLVTPARNTGAVGSLQNLAAQISNAGNVAATITVQASLPSGVALIGAQPAVPSSAQSSGATQVSWSLNLAPGQSAVVALQATAYLPGTYSVPFVVQSSANGASSQSQTVAQGFSLVATQDLGTTATRALNTLAPVQAADVSAANQARNAATNANTLMLQGNYADSLAAWVSAADSVRAITSLDTSTARQALAQALQGAERQVCQQWACITGKLDFSVNNQTARQVPLLGTIQGSRTVFNNCPAQIKDIPVTSSWVNRRTGAQVQNLWDNLTIPGNSNNVRLNGWQADSQQQANDIIDVLLTANWQNQTLFLARDQFQVVVLPSVLNGSVSISPTHAKAGQNVTIARTIKNSGAMGNNIPVSIRVTDTTQGGKLLQQFDQTLTLNPGETNNGNTNWQVSGTGGDQVKVELLATVNGVVQVLGSTNFTIDK